MQLNSFQKLCNHHHLIPKHYLTPQKKLHAYQSHFLIQLSLQTPRAFLFWMFHEGIHMTCDFSVLLFYTLGSRLTNVGA